MLSQIGGPSHGTTMRLSGSWRSRHPPLGGSAKRKSTGDDRSGPDIAAGHRVCRSRSSLHLPSEILSARPCIDIPPNQGARSLGDAVAISLRVAPGAVGRCHMGIYHESVFAVSLSILKRA